MTKTLAKKPIAKSASDHELKRYFIEVQTALDHAPRSQETALRRAQASRFIVDFSQWLVSQDLTDKVSSMAITALGQVQITCAADVISQIRHQDDMQIAAIRQAAPVYQTMDRFFAAR